MTDPTPGDILGNPDTPAPDAPAPEPTPEPSVEPSAPAPDPAPAEVPDPHLAPVETSQPDWNLSNTPAETLEPEVAHVSASTDEGQAILHAAALGIVSAQRPDLSDEELGEAVQRYIDMNANTLLPALRATLEVQAANQEVSDGS